MGLEVSHNLGIYFEINAKKEIYQEYKYCKNESCSLHDVKLKKSSCFCSGCGNANTHIKIKTEERFFSLSEIEEDAELKEDILTSLDHSCYSQFFGYNRSIYGVPEYNIDDCTYNDVEI